MVICVMLALDAKRDSKSRQYAQSSRIGSAVSKSHRLAPSHLQQLHRAQLVTARRDGLHARCRVSQLRTNGHCAHRLTKVFRKWRLAGRPIRRSP